MNYFANILFGHLFGDFVFQNKWMAVNKSASHFKCFVHCSIYTLCMCLFTWKWSPAWIGAIFITHFIIDRWSLADKWLLLIKGRALKEYIDFGHWNIPYSENPNGRNLTQQMGQSLNYQILRGGFASVVYTVVDNTWHLAIAYYLYPYL